MMNTPTWVNNVESNAEQDLRPTEEKWGMWMGARRVSGGSVYLEINGGNYAEK